jgi:putative peptidoglycan lipid II flippase
MFKNTLLVTICLILSSVLGFLAQIVFASSFGASVEMDIYFKILSVPAIVTGMSAIIFSSVLIPTFAKFKSNQSELNKFIDSIWICILVFGVFFILIGFFVSAVNIDLFIPENTAYLRHIGIQVSLMVWIGSGFAIMSGYLSAILNYNEQFFKVSVTSLLPAFFMITIVLLFHNELGVRSISLGFCIAFILQFIILLKASKISLKFFRFNIEQIPYKKLLVEQSFLVTLSLLPFTILTPIAYFWASNLQAGSISYLGYSQSFAGFLSVAVSMGISIVSLPKLADEFANGKGESSLYQFEQSLRYVLLIAMFAAGALITLRIPILTLFYQRGSFNAESVNNLSSVVPWYLLAAVFIGGLNLLRTLFYSRGEVKNIARLGLIIPVIFFVLAGVLKEKFSFVGIGIAYAITLAVLFFMTVHLAKKEEVKFLTNNFLIFILKNAISVVVAILVVTFSLLIISKFTSQLVSIVVCLFLFAVVYIFCSKFVFELKEIEDIKLIVVRQLKLSNKS